MIDSIGVPVSEYDHINSTARLTNTAKRQVAGFLGRSSYDRILLFGASLTGQAVKSCLGERFAGFVDSTILPSRKGDEGNCIIITTSPVHAPVVERTLAASVFRNVPVIRLFSENELDIRLVLETQPRCGTDYTIKNLRKSFGFGYASVFSDEGDMLTQDGLMSYRPQDCNGYVVKSHFTKTLHYPQYRYCPTLFLVGFFPDTYYRWARMYAGVNSADRDSYFLRTDSPEWARVQGYIPLHCQWLDYIRKKDYIRYEDYYNDFEGVMDTFEDLLGERPSGFEQPRLIKSRTYWSGEYERYMDATVWSLLQAEFESHLNTYYPEKI